MGFGETIFGEKVFEDKPEPEFEARIEKFDNDLAWKQIAVATQLTDELMKADLKKIAITVGDKENLSYGFSND